MGEKQLNLTVLRPNPKDKEREYRAPNLERAGDAESYRAGMGQRVGAKPLVQGVGRQHLGFDSCELFDFNLDACKAEQGGSTLDGVDQNIQVTALYIVTARGGTKNAGIAGAVVQNNATNVIAVDLQGGRGFHEAGGESLNV